MNIRSIHSEDHATWLRLWQGYLEFYKASVSDAQTQLTWQRLLEARHPLQGFVAQEKDDVIGFAHCFMHGSTWNDVGYCYLEDLYVDSLLRGRGVARQLIEHTTQWASSQGAKKLYWHTQDTNYAGRILYDKVAKRSSNIHYERLFV